jgi:tRNA pseudouridine38-40 synthase
VNEKDPATIRTATFGLIVEYDGTDFHGSQLQANARTVQGELERALAAIMGRRTRVRLASRTDAGVHATAQVAVFEAQTRLGADSLRKALNHHLPEDIRVRCAQTAQWRFDPRRRARSREYVYTLNDSVTAPAVFRRTESHVRQRLDEQAMQAAAREFVGAHDFAAFAGPGVAEAASTVRRIDAAAVCREGDRVLFTVRGNAFLHQQVRRMTSALVEAGTGKTGPGAVSALLAGGKRRNAGRIVAPHGLCLISIQYDGAGPCGLPDDDTPSPSGRGVVLSLSKELG